MEIPRHLLKAREKSRVQVAICFSFPFHWFIPLPFHGREIFQAIAKRSNCNHVITFDSHLKTALTRFIKPFNVCLTGVFVSLTVFSPWKERSKHTNEKQVTKRKKETAQRPVSLWKTTQQEMKVVIG